MSEKYRQRSEKEYSFTFPVYTRPLFREHLTLDGNHTVVVVFERHKNKGAHEKGTTYGYDPKTADVTVKHTFGKKDAFLHGTHNLAENTTGVEGGITLGRFGLEAVVIWDHNQQKLKGEFKILDTKANIGLGHTVDIYQRSGEPLPAAA